MDFFFPLNTHKYSLLNLNFYYLKREGPGAPGAGGISLLCCPDPG